MFDRFHADDLADLFDGGSGNMGTADCAIPGLASAAKRQKHGGNYYRRCSRQDQQSIDYPAKPGHPTAGSIIEQQRPAAIGLLVHIFHETSRWSLQALGKKILEKPAGLFEQRSLIWLVITRR